jgi:hypothetical protein
VGNFLGNSNTMFIKSASRFVAAVAFCATSLSLAGMAHANYTIKLDCHGTNGQPTWAGTPNTIKVETQKKNNGVWATLCNVVAPSCGTEDSAVCTSTSFVKADFSNVRISTNGNNAYFLDELIMSDAAGTVAWGIDNNFGWCFSMTPSDGNNQFCDAATARTTLTFATGF